MVLVTRFSPIFFMGIWLPFLCSVYLLRSPSCTNKLSLLPHNFCYLTSSTSWHFKTSLVSTCALQSPAERPGPSMYLGLYGWAHVCLTTLFSMLPQCSWIQTHMETCAEEICTISQLIDRFLLCFSTLPFPMRRGCFSTWSHEVKQLLVLLLSQILLTKWHKWKSWANALSVSFTQRGSI